MQLLIIILLQPSFTFVEMTIHDNNTSLNVRLSSSILSQSIIDIAFAL